MLMKLKDKAALITGASMGIGAAIAKLFAKEGCKVVISDIEKAAGLATQKEIENQGGQCLFLECDVSNAASVKKMSQEALAFCGNLHILVNNAAIWRPGSVTELTEELWDQVIDTNLKSIFLVSREIIPAIQKSSGGSIINIASVAGLVGGRESSAYNASKGGVVNLTRAMALDYASDHIRVNCICPGLIKSAQGDMVVAYYAPGQDPEPAMASWQPLSKMGMPQDVARAALYFASDDSDFATGSIFVIDGGLTAE